PEELISLLESIRDLGTSGDQINTWFLRVARALYREDGPSVIGLFTDLVAKGKLLCMGETITKISHLPLLWDRRPLPESTVGVLLPPERPDEAAAVMEAVSRLGWPVLSKRSVAVRPSPCVELENKDWRLLNRVLGELRKLFEKSDPVAARRLSAMPFALTLDSLKVSLRPATDVTLAVEGVESVFNVSYWRN